MIDLVVDEEVGGRLADEGALAERMSRMLEAARRHEGGGQELEASLRLVTDATIHALNRDYRGKDAPTDVLAFAQREGEGGHLHPHLLGDVVISLDTAERQRGAKPLFDEVLFLAAHGLCHLLGYDHQTDAEEAEMNAVVAALLEATGTS